MKRRAFITLLGGAAAWPLAARAQQPAMPVVGYLGTESLRLFARQVRAFQQGLSEMGYAEGRNVSIEYRWAEGQADRLLPLATDLVSRGVAVIATSTSDAALAAKKATTVIPVVVLTAGDPVASGLVASLARPGGNVTGVTSLNIDVVPKRLELMHELISRAASIAVLVNPANPVNAERITKDCQAAARTLARELEVLRASTEPDLDAAFANIDRLRVGGLVVGTGAFFNLRHERIAALALRYSVPTIFNYREFATAGGLMSYGGSNTEGWRLVGVYTGRILKGDKPSELPFQQAAKVELVINMKTAKALGITFPITILGRADEVIE
jgi:putative tryptophan/tyrosine transport system substrate-binding protein